MIGGADAHVDAQFPPRDAGFGPAGILQRLTHQAKLEILEVAQAAVEELGRGGGCRLSQIALLGQRDRQAASRCIAGNAAAIDAAADDEQVADRLALHRVSLRIAA